MARSQIQKGIAALAFVVWLAVTVAGCVLNAQPPPQPIKPDQATGYPSPDSLPAVQAVPIGDGPADLASGEPLPFRMACGAHAPRDLASKQGFREYELTAFNIDGRAIENLNESDLVATTQGKTVPIAMFTQASPAYSIVILIDTSGSMKPKLEYVRAGIQDFIEKLPPQEQLALFAFSGHAFLLQPFTTNHSLAVERLALLHAYGETATYDTIVQAVAYLDGKGINGSRAILLITDGIDNASTKTIDDAAKQMRLSGVSLYVIGIGNPSPSKDLSGLALGPFSLPNLGDADRVDAASLQSLADASGGKFWLVRTGTDHTATDFNDALETAAQSFGSSYSIGLILPTQSESKDTVQFTIKSHPDAKISVCEAAPSPFPAVTKASQ